MYDTACAGVLTPLPSLRRRGRNEDRGRFHHRGRRGRRGQKREDYDGWSVSAGSVRFVRFFCFFDVFLRDFSGFGRVSPVKQGRIGVAPSAPADSGVAYHIERAGRGVGETLASRHQRTMTVRYGQVRTRDSHSLDFAVVGAALMEQFAEDERTLLDEL